MFWWIITKHIELYFKDFIDVSKCLRFFDSMKQTCSKLQIHKIIFMQHHAIWCPICYTTFVSLKIVFLEMRLDEESQNYKYRFAVLLINRYMVCSLISPTFNGQQELRKKSDSLLLTLGHYGDKVTSGFKFIKNCWQVDC